MLVKKSFFKSKSKFWLKIAILVKNKIWSEIEILVKNPNFGQKSKFWSKIPILVKNGNVGLKSKFWQKIQSLVNLKFGQFKFWSKIRILVKIFTKSQQFQTPFPAEIVTVEIVTDSSSELSEQFSEKFGENVEIVSRSGHFLRNGMVVWAAYGNEIGVFYPAVVREVLDPRSNNVKISYSDKEMNDKVISVKKSLVYLIQDIQPRFKNNVWARNLILYNEKR